MKVKIIGRKIYLPKKLIEETKIPENGYCEAIVVGDEIRIRRISLEELKIFELLENPKQSCISEMVKAEEVEDV